MQPVRKGPGDGEGLVEPRSLLRWSAALIAPPQMQLAESSHETGGCFSPSKSFGASPMAQQPSSVALQK
jgi:hypothetical protein